MRGLKHLIFPVIFLFVLGMVGCVSSERIVLDPESRDFYDTAQFIMKKEEKKIFKHLPDQESREEFINEFWAKRDPDPDTEENEFKQEFFKRVEYANQRFKEGIPGWKTDRGRIYIIFGPPDKIERNPVILGSNIKGLLLWVYFRYDFAIEFVDKRGNGTYNFDPYTGVHGDFFAALEEVKLEQIFRTEGDLEQKSVNFEVAFDSKKNEIVVSIPVYSLIFKAEDGLLKADFEFEFFIYEKEGKGKNKFSRDAHFEKKEDEVLQLNNIIFTFPFDLKPGEYYFDVAIFSKEIVKTRKIFEITVRKYDG